MQEEFIITNKIIKLLNEFKIKNGVNPTKIYVGVNTNQQLKKELAKYLQHTTNIEYNKFNGITLLTVLEYADYIDIV